MRRQIVALGGGGFSMKPDYLALDRYVLAQSGKDNPRVCFIPTASGDKPDYVNRFYKAFNKLSCKADHLSLFEPNFRNLRTHVLEQDVLYVGGGSTRNMLTLWHDWKLDHILCDAYQKGIVLAGLSAGANCWFEEGLTDPLNGSYIPLTG
jgi:dipeptidase E